MKRSISKHICLLMSALMLCGALTFAAPASAYGEAAAVAQAPTVADAYTCKPVSELTEGDTILYNDETVKKAIETSLYGQGSADSKKDVAKYAKYVSIGLDKPSILLEDYSLYGYYSVSPYLVEGEPYDGVVDLSALQLCTNMVMAIICCDEVTGLEALTKCKNLKCVILKTNKPVDLSVLAECKSLLHVAFADSKGYDYKPLSECKSLTATYFFNCSDVSMLFAYGVKKMRRVDLIDCTVRCFSALAAPGTLEYLTLENTQVPSDELNIVLAMNAKKMAWLELTGVDCAGLPALFDCAALTNLTLVDCAGINTAPDAWKKLTKISSLEMNNCGLTDCSFMSNMKKLDWVSLNNNQISDISAFAGRKKLSTIHLKNNSITDVSPLKGIKIDGWLSLEGNPIEDKELLKEIRESSGAW